MRMRMPDTQSVLKTPAPIDLALCRRHAWRRTVTPRRRRRRRCAKNGTHWRRWCSSWRGRREAWAGSCRTRRWVVLGGRGCRASYTNVCWDLCMATLVWQALIPASMPCPSVLQARARAASEASAQHQSVAAAATARVSEVEEELREVRDKGQGEGQGRSGGACKGGQLGCRFCRVLANSHGLSHLASAAAAFRLRPRCYRRWRRTSRPRPQSLRSCKACCRRRSPRSCASDAPAAPGCDPCLSHTHLHPIFCCWSLFCSIKCNTSHQGQQGRVVRFKPVWLRQRARPARTTRRPAQLVARSQRPLRHPDRPPLGAGRHGRLGGGERHRKRALGAELGRCAATHHLSPSDAFCRTGCRPGCA